MKTIFTLLTCNAWHNFAGMDVIGAFTTKEKAVQFAIIHAHNSEDGKIDSDDIVLLKTISQTQNRSENYQINQHYMNPQIP